MAQPHAARAQMTAWVLWPTAVVSATHHSGEADLIAPKIAGRIGVAAGVVDGLHAWIAGANSRIAQSVLFLPTDLSMRADCMHEK